jgi:hypothetical protein
MTIISGFFVVNQAKNFGVLNGLNNDRDLSLIASIGALFDVMRFLWSWWLDYTSFKKVFGTLIACQIFLNFTIFVADKTWYSYALWVWMFMFCQGGVLVLMPNIFKRIYGSKAIAVYGFFGSFVSMTSLIQIGLNELFLKDTIRSYNAFFIANGILSCCAIALLLTQFDEKPYVPKCHRV